MKNLNETIGPTCGAGPELESRKDSYYASSRQQDHKKRATANWKMLIVALSYFQRVVIELLRVVFS